MITVSFCDPNGRFVSNRVVTMAAIIYTWPFGIFHLLFYLFLSHLSTLPVDASEFAFTVEVPAGQFQCFFQVVEQSKFDAGFKTMEIDYQVGEIVVLIIDNYIYIYCC